MEKLNSRRAFLGKAAGVAAIAAVSPLTRFGNGYQQAITAASKASAPSDLKITDVKCGYIGGSLFVKIYTNQDIYGCGEGVDAIGGTYYLVQNSFITGSNKPGIGVDINRETMKKYAIRGVPFFE